MRTKYAVSLSNTVDIIALLPITALERPFLCLKDREHQDAQVISKECT